MDHARNFGGATGSNIDHGSHGRTRSGNSTEETSDGVTDSLAYQFTI